MILQWERSGSIQGPKKKVAARMMNDDDGRGSGENKQLIAIKAWKHSAGRGARVVVSRNSFISTQKGVRLVR